MTPTTIVASLAGAAAILVWRVRETQRPVTSVTLLAPPLAMTAGFGMFLMPDTRVPLSWALAALAAGAIFFSYPMTRTSHVERHGNVVTLRRSKVFLWILLGLVILRLALRGWLEGHVSAVQTGSLFFLVAFGMLLPWRLAMFARYRRVRASS